MTRQGYVRIMPLVFGLVLLIPALWAVSRGWAITAALDTAATVVGGIALMSVGQSVVARGQNFWGGVLMATGTLVTAVPLFQEAGIESVQGLRPTGSRGRSPGTTRSTLLGTAAADSPRTPRT
jgi:hypothetical protein